MALQTPVKADPKKSGRLKKRPEFLRVQQSGIKWVAKGMIVQLAGNGLDQVRFGLTVTKKTSASAVVRNRIRRRLRAAAIAVLPQHAKTGTDCVLIGRIETEKRPYDDLCRDLIWCLDKTGFSREKV